MVGRIEEAGPPATKDGQAAPERPAPPTPAQENKAGADRPAAPPAEIPLSPAVRELVAREGLDVSQVKGTGPRGRITREDVVQFLKEKKARTPPEPSPPTASPSRDLGEGPERRERMTAIRQRIAERLVAAQKTAAILTTFNEADLSAVIALRHRYKQPFQERHGVGLGFMSFFVKACVEALKAYPVVNAWIEGSDIVYHDYYHIGIAVSTEKGLLVPVVRDADQLSFAGIEKRIEELARKARDGKIAIADLQGGTFTITNGGVFGSLLSTPLLNPPQSAILGMHTTQKRPVAVGDQVVIRPMMYLALSYDHRLIDGREAVSFLVGVKERIEQPERLFLGV